MDIILFNGPPSSGKDEAAKFLRDNWDSLDLPGNPVLRRMSHPHKEMFAAMVGAKCDADGNVAGWESVKDRPHWLLNDKSYRQWQIEFSEYFMKPLYGDDVFVRLFANYIEYKDPSTVYLVPDCGFDIEAEYLAKLPRVNLFLLRIHRSGKDFSNDSRSYIDPIGIPSERKGEILNDSTLTEYHNHLADVMVSWLGFRRPH